MSLVEMIMWDAMGRLAEVRRVARSSGGEARGEKLNAERAEAIGSEEELMRKSFSP